MWNYYLILINVFTVQSRWWWTVVSFSCFGIRKTTGNNINLLTSWSVLYVENTPRITTTWWFPWYVHMIITDIKNVECGWVRNCMWKLRQEYSFTKQSKFYWASKISYNIHKLILKSIYHKKLTWSWGGRGVEEYGFTLPTLCFSIQENSVVSLRLEACESRTENFRVVDWVSVLYPSQIQTGDYNKEEMLLFTKILTLHFVTRSTSNS